ncbi:ABC transporter ATP-binding protein [Alphaproteobacteria bacterium]|jgi:ABC-2 type transport system ATP-binding protein|nr:ABC transporter ATP-binding protein [Alphaproteobacteria bacterium]MDA9806915.1 ABC transporter ATP-binding protein [Alphaproteobacteria bacterium]
MKTKYWDFPENRLAVEIKNLNKIYNDENQNFAVENVSLEIPTGSIFGLLGPNGAGKSTLINIISGVVIKTSGNVSIWGYDIDKERKQSKLAIGVVPQELNIDAFFTPKEMLNLHSGMFNVPKSSWISHDLLELMDLTDKASTYSRKLSGGMRRRLLVAKAMVHSPPIIILDEPTAGVDVELRQKLWENFIKLNKQGVTIILTTHYLEEAEYLCDHIAIINKGKIIANEKKETLLTKFNQKIIKIKINETKISKKDMLSLQKIGSVKLLESEIEINYKLNEISMKNIIEILYKTELDIIDLSTKEVSLEDVFINLTSNH